MSPVGILDFGMGNLKSVFNAFEYLDQEPEIIRTPEQILKCGRLVLPGVGAYSQAMQSLTSLGVLPAIHEFVASGRPVLGICLGMQIFSDYGYEKEEKKGLGLVPGKVERLSTPQKLRLPHVGWNTITMTREHPLFKGVKRGSDFYFVHSYYFNAESSSSVLTTTHYGIEFPSSIFKDNLVGLQFHPEKSQTQGLKILDNFSSWDGRC